MLYAVVIFLLNKIFKRLVLTMIMIPVSFVDSFVVVVIWRLVFLMTTQIFV